MENKVCSCCKTEIIDKSIKADELYIIRIESYNYHKNLDEYDYNFYVKCRNCNSLIKITTEEAKEILNNCGYECEYYRWHYQLNVLETNWKDDYPNNFKSIEWDLGYNPNDIFKIKVEINISDDIVSNLDNARKYLNNVHSILNDNISDKKCQNAYRQLSDILHDFDKLENVIKEIKNEKFFKKHS
jgi:hypothetical protein